MTARDQFPSPCRSLARCASTTSATHRSRSGTLSRKGEADHRGGAPGGRRGTGALCTRIRQGAGRRQSASPRLRLISIARRRSSNPKSAKRSTFAAGSIRKFHEDQKPEEMWFHEIRPGVFAGDRMNADSLGCLLHTARQGGFSKFGDDAMHPGHRCGRRRISQIVTPPGP